MRKIIYALAAALAVFIVALFFLDQKQALTLFLIFFMVGLWTNEALPLGVVSLLPLVLFPSFHILSFKETAPHYAQPVIFLFLGGFLLAIAVEKTALHEYVARKLLSIFPPTPLGLIYSVAIAAALVSSILSNTAVTLMLLPIVLMMSDHRKLKTRLLLALAYGASIGGILTPIGTPPNLILFGFLEKNQLQHTGFIGWLAMMLPLVGLMLFIVPYLLAFSIRKVEISIDRQKPQKMNQSQKKVFYFILALFVLLLLNSKIDPWYKGLGLDERIIFLAAGIFLFLPGVHILSWPDTKKIPFEIIFLFGAGFSIASAFLKSDLAQIIAEPLQSMASLEPWTIIFFSALLVSFATEVTSNTAFISIALPVFYELTEHIHFNQNILLMVATVATSYAFMLPIATPPNAIVISSGHLNIKEMMKRGFWVNLLGVSILTFIASMFWTR